eukprot:TRINITY_DN7842_c0_g1_i1.p1 TRINITY_DN7842_c0_g1~~TRINITY_DN7842_c0_g1_i1.p1  ORF type:complete len:488 (+),score=82.40 TRINITY_DN7842_c0_g1_i1:170-1633(+)
MGSHMTLKQSKRLLTQQTQKSENHQTKAFLSLLMKYIHLLFFFTSFITFSYSSVVYNVLDYGAVGDGVTYDTEAIQKTIDTANSNGGGIVLIPSSYTFLTAQLYLKSYTTLYLEVNSEISCGSNRQDYNSGPQDLWYCILANDERDVSIEGSGIIYGNALNFVIEKNPLKYIMKSWNSTTDNCTGTQCRPRLVGFVNCTNVDIKDVYLNNSAFWTLHLLNSSHVTVDNVDIYGDFNIPNNDGIDIDSGHDIKITNCNINTGDDNICPKTIEGAELTDLIVSGCVLRSKSSAIKFGSATHSNFKNALFTNIIINESHRGLALQLRDEGNIENVMFSNIEMTTRLYNDLWWGMAEPIYITSVPRTANQTALGQIKNVQFNSITSRSENGVFIAGSNITTISEIKFNDVDITVDKFTENIIPPFHDYRPGYLGLETHATNAIYMEYIDSIEITDSSFRFGSNVPDYYGSLFETLPKTAKHFSFSSVTFDQ